MIRHLPPSSALAQLKETRLPVQIADVRQEPVYNETHTDNATRVAFTHLTGVRSLLAIPMVNGEILIGAIMIYRQEVRPFTEKQIELMQTRGCSTNCANAPTI
jgi:GAF domain-containing protein